LAFELLKKFEKKVYNSDFLIGYHFLQLLCLTELRRKEAVEIKLDSFRKFLTRNKLMHGRTLLIYKFFKALVKYKFNLNSSIEHSRDIIENLKSAKDEYRWDPYGFEVIRFENWIEESLITKDFTRKLL
jgi:hypothetical protein